MAQLGRAPRLGRGGRTFKSCHPDHLKRLLQRGLFCIMTRFCNIFINSRLYRGTKHAGLVRFTHRLAVRCIRFPKLAHSLRESLSSRPFKKDSVRSLFCIIGFIKLFKILQFKQIYQIFWH